MPVASRLLDNLGPRPGTSLISLSFNGSPVKSRNFCDVVDDMTNNLEKKNGKLYLTAKKYIG